MAASRQYISKTSLTRYGEGIAPYYRIPGIVVTAQDTILAYFETRENASDWSAHTICMYRSTDGGCHWSEINLLVQSAEPINNPVMISSPEGRIYFLWEKEYARGFLQYSDDDGLTFSNPREITHFIDGFRTLRGYDWDVFAFGPGHGIAMENGNLVVPLWLANGGARSHHPSVVSTIVSADKGKTWDVGEIIYPTEENGMISPSETTAVETSQGDVMLNLRHEGKQHFRTVTTSPDGLTDFSPIVYDTSLPDPISFGSLARGQRKNKQVPIAFVNCAVQPTIENFYSRRRKKLTLRLSYDDGATWQYSRLLEEYGGYADIAFSKDNQWLYCFYEHDIDDERYTQPKYLTFAKVNIEWLSDSQKRINFTSDNSLDSFVSK